MWPDAMPCALNAPREKSGGRFHLYHEKNTAPRAERTARIFVHRQALAHNTYSQRARMSSTAYLARSVGRKALQPVVVGSGPTVGVLPHNRRRG